MSAPSKLILFVTLGFVAVLAAFRVPELGTQWRGAVILAGGWLMAIGILYQVKIYAAQKDPYYYVLLVFAGVLWLSMLAITILWV